MSKLPPQWPKRMLQRFCSEKHLDVLLGDLDELYDYRLETYGKYRARLHYVKDAFGMLRPFTLKKIKPFGVFNKKHNTTAMFKNYFKISLRNMLRHKVYAGINIIGLSMGIACFLLIALYVQDELSYDRYHEHADDIYRVVVENYDADGETSRVFGYSSVRYGEVLREYPQVEKSVRFYPFNFPVIRYGEKQFEEYYFNFVEPEILDIFSFKFVEGTPEKALDEPYSVIITQSTAKKYFGDELAFGKVLTVIDQEELLYKVTGVVEDFPEQSHMDYNFMASWSTFEKTVSPERFEKYYGDYNYPTYVKLAGGTKIDDLTAQMPAMFDKYIDEVQGVKPSTRMGIVFQKLTNIHLYGTPGSSNDTGVYYLYLFSGIGVLVLLIACINYMNLATAKYSNRLKEIGVRKVMGARAKHVSQQFLTESLLYVVFALIVSLGLVMLFLPSINQYTEKSLALNLIENANLSIFLIIMTLLIGVLAGSYPSFFMSRFKAIRALKGGKVLNAKNPGFRTGLVVFQFTLTIGLIISVAVVQSQLNFIHNQDPGFDRERVVTFWGSPAINEQLADFTDRLKANPSIIGVSASSRVPTGRLSDSMDAVLYNENTEELVDFRLAYLTVDSHFLELYDLEMTVGDWFRDEVATDSSQTFLVNETAMKRLGFDHPDAVLGQLMTYGPYKGFIGGVVKDFHFESLRSDIQPMIFLHVAGDRHMVSAKISPNGMPETMAFLEEEFVRLNPGRTFDGAFLEDSFNRQYLKEQALSSISTLFSVLAIVIACLGLLGLVGFTLEQRAKEISVRKVLGASVTGILILVNKRYLILIACSFVIAVPIAYYLLMGWLDTFAYHIDISIGIILLSGCMAVIVAVLTISAQAMKVAVENPVRYLKNE